MDPGRFLDKKDQMEKDEKKNKLNGHTLNLVSMSLSPSKSAAKDVIKDEDSDAENDIV